MPMKKTDLEKNKGLRIADRVRQAGASGRFGAGAAQAQSSRRERRRAEQALGLVPFAVKLEAALAERLRARAQADGVPLDALVGRLLEAALGGDEGAGALPSAASPSVAEADQAATGDTARQDAESPAAPA